MSPQARTLMRRRIEQHLDTIARLEILLLGVSESNTGEFPPEKDNGGPASANVAAHSTSSAGGTGALVDGCCEALSTTRVRDGESASPNMPPLSPNTTQTRLFPDSEQASLRGPWKSTTPTSTTTGGGGSSPASSASNTPSGPRLCFTADELLKFRQYKATIVFMHEGVKKNARLINDWHETELAERVAKIRRDLDTIKRPWASPTWGHAVNSGNWAGHDSFGGVRRRADRHANGEQSRLRLAYTPDDLRWDEWEKEATNAYNQGYSYVRDRVGRRVHKI